MPSPSATTDRAHVCTVNSPAITSAGIQYAVSQCGEFVTVSQILMALGLDPSTLPASIEANIRAWLDGAGWERVKRTIDGTPVWVYARPVNTGMPRTGSDHVKITFAVDLQGLGSFTEGYLAQLWHISQANPAPFGDPAAGEFADRVGHEIIRRFVLKQPPELWSHQANDACVKAGYSATAGAAA